MEEKEKQYFFKPVFLLFFLTLWWQYNPDKNKQTKESNKYILLKNRTQERPFLCSSQNTVVFLSGAK